MIRTAVYKIYKLSKESATIKEALKRIISECNHGLLSKVMEVTSILALNYRTSMDGSLREQNKEMVSKIFAIVNATLGDILMQNEGNDYGKVIYLIKMFLIVVEREILCLAQNTDLLQILMQMQEIEKQDTPIRCVDQNRIEELVDRIIDVFECKNFHELGSIIVDYLHLVSDLLSMCNPGKETVECKVIMEEELD